VCVGWGGVLVVVGLGFFFKYTPPNLQKKKK